MKIGKHSYIGEPSNITAPLIIGSYTSIAPHVQVHNLVQHPKLITNFPFSGLPIPQANENPVVIGSDVWIGQGAILLNGITIGDGAIIGSYAVVAHDVEPYSIQVGNPAKSISYRYTGEQIKQLLKIRWWDWTDEEIAKRKRDFILPIDEFIAKYNNG
ncbi:MAG TPA: CatB-related O-acetyltransferase [Clostridia bacterium]